MIHVEAVTATVIGSLINRPRSNKNEVELINKLMPFGMGLFIKNRQHRQRKAFLQSVPSSSP